jgi:FixJ family two-component response regulator
MPLSPPIVYIVDDDASMLRALSRLLTLAGYAVEAFVYSSELVRGVSSGVVCGATGQMSELVGG